MWVVEFLPAWFFYFTFLASVAALVATFFISFLPFFKQYVLPVRIIATLVLVGSAWYLGGHANEEKWIQRVRELEEKVRIAEQKSQQANEQIEVKVVEKTKVIKEKGQLRIEYVNKLVKGDTVEIVKDMSEEERQKFLVKQKELQDAIKNCPVPRILVEEHNKVVDQK
jgi:hypothetical protein